MENKLEEAVVINDFITSENILLTSGQFLRILYHPDSINQEPYIEIWRVLDGKYCGILDYRLETSYIRILKN